MPRGNGTGPQGQGSGTGRGLGYCAGTGAPGFVSVPGRGGRFGFGQAGAGQGMMGRRGMGRGMQRGGGAWGYDPMSAGQAGPQANPDNPALERQYLLQQAKTLENALASIKARLDALRPATDQA